MGLAGRLLVALLLLSLTAATASITATSTTTATPNILFIIVEDLRVEPWFGPHAPQALTKQLTPNIFRLITKGVSFIKAYCQVTICAPSRTSLLTGLRPDTLGIYDFSHYGGVRYFRTITSHFHRMGYQTSMAGKLQHWDSYRYYSSNYWGHPAWDAVQHQESRVQNSSVTADAERNDPLSFYRDSFVLKEALRSLRDMEERRLEAERKAASGKLSDAPEPWFLAVGFKGTHMPYHVPKRFHDLYKNVRFERDVSSDGDDPFRFPPSAPLLHHVTKTEATQIIFAGRRPVDKGEGPTFARGREQYQSTTNALNKTRDVRGGVGVRISDEGWKELYGGYLACLSYTDFLIGKLFDAMDAGVTADKTELWSNTIVVLTSDHGMHVGEKGVWGKWTLFEESTHVPLIISLPTVNSKSKSSSGGLTVVSQPVELLDIFPTLVEASGTQAGFDRPCEVLVEEREAFNTSVDSVLGPAYRIPKGGPRQPVQGEGKVRNVEGHIFRHVYCDKLDGVSLVPLMQRGRQVPSRRSFALSQKMTCKLPPRGSPSPYTDTNPQTPNWIDFCPNKRLPRDPPYGAMGYALTSVEWKYIAWLTFDTNTYLPLLHLPPLAEELYPLSLRPTSPTSSSNGGELVIRSYGQEMHNLATSTSTSTANVNSTSVLREMRLSLYDFLWNARHPHLYHHRLDDQRKNAAVIVSRAGANHPTWQSERHYFRSK